MIDDCCWPGLCCNSLRALGCFLLANHRFPDLSLTHRLVNPNQWGVTDGTTSGGLCMNVSSVYCPARFDVDN